MSEMSESNPTAPHRSEEVSLALLNHRMKAVEVMCARSVEQGDLLLAAQAKIDTQLAVVAVNMKEIDKHLEATDTRVTTIEADKRGLWSGIGGVAAAVGSFLYSFFHGK
jgi:hypothetical protein